MMRIYFYALATTGYELHTHCLSLYACLAPRLVTAACYRELNETMKLLWSKDLHMNTVHVIDVVKAAWHVAELPDPSGTVYNLADKGGSS